VPHSLPAAAVVVGALAPGAAAASFAAHAPPLVGPHAYLNEEGDEKLDVDFFFQMLNLVCSNVEIDIEKINIIKKVE
jgi:hypothetical protein